MTLRPDSYGTIRLPEPLIAKVEEFVEQNEWGFRTKAEVVAAAVREFLQRNLGSPKDSRAQSASPFTPEEQARRAAELRELDAQNLGRSPDSRKVLDEIEEQVRQSKARRDAEHKKKGQQS